MMQLIEQLAVVVAKRLRAMALSTPSPALISTVLRTVQTASMLTEEGRFLSGSVTLMNPKEVNESLPMLVRADYPRFTQLSPGAPFRPPAFAKLARAVDRWSGSVAIWGRQATKITMWGIVDQQVGTNKHLTRESVGGFGAPGICTVVIERPGDFAIYHSNTFLGALRAQEIVLNELEGFDIGPIFARFQPRLRQTAIGIRSALPSRPAIDSVVMTLFHAHTDAIARICIGLRRAGCGGSLIITPTPKRNALSISNDFDYDRLGSSVALQCLDELYKDELEEKLGDLESIEKADFREYQFALADAEDRVDELNGSVKFVTSLAALDGATVMTPDLRVLGFGAKIKTTSERVTIYDASSYFTRRSKRKRIDLSKFGTRHSSMCAYCARDRNAIGIVVSQDGLVRVVLSFGNDLVMWNGIKLLSHTNFNARTARATKDYRTRAKKRSRVMRKFGYSTMPKTLTEILGAQKKNK
jgi:hypothetical protein